MKAITFEVWGLLKPFTFWPKSRLYPLKNLNFLFESKKSLSRIFSKIKAKVSAQVSAQKSCHRLTFNLENSQTKSFLFLAERQKTENRIGISICTDMETLFRAKLSVFHRGMNYQWSSKLDKRNEQLDINLLF